MSDFEDIDRGYDEIMNRTARLDGKKVVIGILSDKSSDDGENLAQIAAANEFGTDKIPARSFMRSTFDENEKENDRYVRSQIGRVLSPKVQADPERVLNLIGMRLVAQVQKKITDLQDPPNAPATVKGKGSSNPLINTGRLRRSIDYEVK